MTMMRVTKPLTCRDAKESPTLLKAGDFVVFVEDCWNVLYKHRRSLRRTWIVFARGRILAVRGRQRRRMVSV